MEPATLLRALAERGFDGASFEWVPGEVVDVSPYGSRIPASSAPRG